MTRPTDADELITPAVAATISALGLQPEDGAAAKLARLYALRIDQATVSGDPKIAAWAARWIAPLLLDALESLGATPAARKRLTGKGGAPPSGENQLAKLRAARAAGRRP